MGAQQSHDSSNLSQPAGANMKEDFYTLLGVDRNADQDEIKKAYRKKALELHPDKNVNNVEAATKLFSEVQAAYEVLSDPQERAWYDSHKDQILREDLDDNDPNNHQQPPINVTLTTSTLLKQFSLFSSRMDMTDSNPQGFYTTASKIFSTLSREEEEAASLANEDVLYYPFFGNSKSDYQDDVKRFYSIWTGFSTLKSFAWVEKYRYRDAPDRRIKRLMEKENKKSRDMAIREFNDTVKQFVLYIRKRDPRYLPNFQSTSELEAASREASKSQSRKARLENAAKVAAYKEADWSKTDDIHNSHEFTDSEDEEDEEEEIQEFECVACNKIFKTENQMEMHEKSKKHIKMVQSIKRQMRKDDIALDLDGDDNAPKLSKSKQKKKNKAKNAKYFDEQDDESEKDDDDADDLSEHLEDDDEDDKAASEEKLSKPAPAENARNPAENSKNVENSDEEEDSDESLTKDAQNMHISDPTSQPSNDDKSQPQKSKMKKARRRAKQSKPDPQESQNKCGVCNESFDSRTKLFQHIKNENHATAIPSSKKSKK
ncbi:hypothetical protein TWF102_005946 [Orbilia oligospora]|uniref:Uncharacterized protein n=2 Tax=Orbilia oligospora TaxID=2813651 RepID=A0A7C8NCC2_ORBOL|nr:hypothetical protein TWF102_005946 [Orbilia oligospora]KAF3108166.1 hypothetical protein TWF103_005718 [Orbilia oligospora]